VLQGNPDDVTGPGAQAVGHRVVPRAIGLHQGGRLDHGGQVLQALLDRRARQVGLTRELVHRQLGPGPTIRPGSAQRRTERVEQVLVTVGTPRLAQTRPHAIRLYPVDSTPMTARRRRDAEPSRRPVAAVRLAPARRCALLDSAMTRLSLLELPAADRHGGERGARRAGAPAGNRAPSRGPGGHPGAPTGGGPPDQHPDEQADRPQIASHERQLRSALLAGSGDAVADAALALADGLAHTARAAERPALLRLAAMHGGSGPRGRALLRLGAALAERGEQSQARAAWITAAHQAEPPVAAAAELELALADLAAGRGRRAQRSLRRLATDLRDPDVAVMARSTLRGLAARTTP